MVLRGGHGAHRLAIGEGQQRALGTGEHLLDDHSAAGGAERAVKALMHGVQGLVEGERHHNALARGQAVGLDDDGSALLAHVGKGGFLVGEGAVGRRGNARAGHELFGETLGSLELGTLGTRAKARDARGANGVGHTGDERRLGADHHQTAAGLARKVRHSSRVLGVEGHVLAHGKRAAVARRDVERAAQRGLGELGRQGMLAAAAAQQQDVDGLLGCAHASSLYASGPQTEPAFSQPVLLSPDPMLAGRSHMNPTGLCNGLSKCRSLGRKRRARASRTTSDD